MIYNSAIPVSVVRENFKSLEPTFKERVTITIDGEKWRIHRLGERVKLKRKSEKLTYFRFQPLERENEETCFFSISSRTGGISLVPSFYEGVSDCETGEKFILLDSTGFFTVVAKSRNDKMMDADYEYELGMSTNFWNVADLLVKLFGKTKYIRDIIKSASSIRRDYHQDENRYEYIRINKI